MLQWGQAGVLEKRVRVPSCELPACSQQDGVSAVSDVCVCSAGGKRVRARFHYLNVDVRKPVSNVVLHPAALHAKGEHGTGCCQRALAPRDSELAFLLTS
jgi:hypothetical protein